MVVVVDADVDGGFVADKQLAVVVHGAYSVAVEAGVDAGTFGAVAVVVLGGGMFADKPLGVGGVVVVVVAAAGIFVVVAAVAVGGNVEKYCAGTQLAAAAADHGTYD